MLAAALCTSPVLADTTLRYDGAGLSRLSISASALRSDQGSHSMLYRSDEDTMYMIDHRQREYTPMGAAEIEQLGATVRDAMAQMEQALANVPPAQRQMVEQMMAKQMGGALMPKIEMVELGTGEAAGHACQRFETRINGRPSQRSCVVEPAALDLGAAEAETLRRFQAHMRAMAEGLGDALGGNTLNLPDGAWIPVQLEDLEGNQDATLVEVQRAMGDYALPEGYKAQKLQLPGR
jgi:hypothetical protein